MRSVLRLLLLLVLPLFAVAQSSLPACPTTGYKNDCFGTTTFGNGNKYVGEFKDDEFNGQVFLTDLGF